MTGIDGGGVGDVPTVESLLTAAAVRERARMVFDAGVQGKLAHFAIDMDRLPACAAYVAATIRQNYPSLKVPPHSRWRHLSANGHDWAERLGDRLSSDRDERARQRVELAVTSVLLDAGAGPDWRWRDPVTGREFARSEGLALASLEAFRTGVFSSDPNQPCRADAEGLAGVSLARLGHAFQVSETNELVGLTGRVQLLKHLGRPFTHIHAIGLSNRVGALFDIMKKDADLGRVRVTEPFWAGFPVQPSADYVGVVFASDILGHVLMWLRDIWPNRTTIDYFSFGDTWRHPAITVAGETRGLIPFHKLSQWLSYSLIEPLEEAGLTVAHQDQLTGLAEYRNGGLFIDMGVIVPRDAALLTTPLTPDREPIVEWRALTITLLDEVAPLVRTELGVTAAQMPLASILEGGTWAAGRRIAKEKRADGGPPLVIVSDGTVF